ncbi:MAG TPA: hypothetical protein VGD14_23125 [bacterium]
MRQKSIIQPVICISLLLMLFPVVTFSQKKVVSLLKKEFNLAGERSQQTQFYIMKSECITFALDGKRIEKDVYKLHLKWALTATTGNARDEFTCIKFSVQFGDAPEVAIPALANWRYSFIEGIDEKNQVFGIDHDKFENLKDSEGNLVPTDKAYHIYNAFIDFHGFCQVFSEQTSDGNGIQDLKRIGQRIVHSAAFSEAPTHLGKNILEGSFFKNGKITLEFKGLSISNDRECALIGIDSGESAFKMIVKPTPEFEVVAVGSSHYKGDIYKDLASNWVQKVVFDEMVVTEVTLPMPPNKINSAVERNIVIQNVAEQELLNF